MPLPFYSTTHLPTNTHPTPHTPRHGPYQPTRSEPPDKNRSGAAASSYRSRPRFVLYDHSDEVAMRHDRECDAAPRADLIALIMKKPGGGG